MSFINVPVPYPATPIVPSLNEALLHAINFLIKPLSGRVSALQLNILAEALRINLADRFSRHWDPAMPKIGSGARCVALLPNGGQPPTPISQACASAQIQWDTWCELLGNKELHVFVNPNAVVVRQGKHSFTLWSGVAAVNPVNPVKPATKRLSPTPLITPIGVAVNTMKAPLSDMSRTLMFELNALEERHHQFRTRVRAADKAARERDEEAQRQNDILTQRIVVLEKELKEGREAIEALRQFVELLPVTKAKFDSFEDEIESFEGVGNNTSNLERIAITTVRVNTLEQNICSIIGPRGSFIASVSDALYDGIAVLSANPISSHYSTTSGTNTHRDLPPPTPYACNVPLNDALAKLPPPPTYPRKLETTTPLYPHIPDPCPARGFRIHLTNASAFPGPHLTGPTEFKELRGGPVYIGSAYIDKGEIVHDIRGQFNPNPNGGSRWGLIPCKIAPAHAWPVRTPFAGREVRHRGNFELLPFIPEIMEWVPAAPDGSLPQGRAWIKGGYENVEGENGAKRVKTKLYHARATTSGGIVVPGRTSKWDKACLVAYDDEVVRATAYDVLCWK